MLKDNCEIEIVVNGKKVNEYLHEGRCYIEAKDGSEFKIKVRNNNWYKVLAIPSVDGLSVIDGEEASSKSRGYIIDPQSTITIDGWRVNKQEVAKFYFTDSKKSYSHKIGKGKENIGVIGIMILPEELDLFPQLITYNNTANKILTNEWIDKPLKWYGWTSETTGQNYRSQTTLLCCSNASSINDNTERSLGTGFGDRKHDEVREVSFRADKKNPIIFEIFYNSRKELEKIGIKLDKPAGYITPSAFPGDRFCKIPD